MFASHQKSIALAAWALLAASSAQAWTTNDIQLILNVMPTGVVHQHQMIPMRDGIRLSTHCFLPAGFASTSYPVVLVRSAYNDWSQRSTYANDVVNQSNPTNFTWINTNGYAYVFQDLRGDGESETNATYEPRLSDNEINDTYDTVEALATNAWSNGRVGMYGSSGHGIAAYMGWFSGAPHLVVAAPGNTAPNLHEHWSFENGVRRWIYNWLQYRNRNNAVMPVWPKPTLGEYYSHDRWTQILAAGPVSNRTILLASDTWHNYMLDNTFDVLAALTTGNVAYLTMDPGTHQGNTSSNGLVFPKKPSTILNVPTLFQILDGAPFTNTPQLKYFVMGDARRTNSVGNYYRFASTWPPVAVPTPFYLHGDGRLDPALPTSTTDTLSYVYHPTNPVPTVGGNFSFGFGNPSGPQNQLVPQLTNRTDILRFETEPFTNAMEIAGPLSATLYVSTDVEDSAFMVKLIDIYPEEGTNPAYHAIMRESAILGRYAGGLTNPAPMVNGQVYRLDINMSSLALLVETNHRVGLHITSSSDPAFEVHPNTYAPVADFSASPTAHHTLHLSSLYPSHLVLPLFTTNQPAVATSTNLLAVPESGTAAFTLHMTGPALHNVTITVARVSGDEDLSVTDSTEHIFTTNTWSIAQTVTLAATPDADGNDGTAVFQLTGNGVEPATLTAQEVDDDPGIITSTTNLPVPEGDQSSFTFLLNRAPAGTVTVEVARVEGDTDVTINGPTSFLFSPSDWNQARTAAVVAAQDEDSISDTARLRCASPLVAAGDVIVMEQDDDHLLLRVDFGLTNAPVESDGAWRGFALPSSTTAKSTSMVYAVGSATVTVTLASGASLNGRDRGQPATDSGALTYAAVYRDLVQSTSGGSITMGIAGLRPTAPYVVRLWIYDYGNANNAVFTNRNLTAGHTIALGALTNNYAVAPLDNADYRVSGVVTSDAGGTLVLLIAAPSAATAARVNGLEIEEGDDRYAFGVPGSWLIGHGLAASQSNALADFDGDHMANWEEYIAGTEPTNQASALRFDQARRDVASGKLVMTWPTVADRRYAVAWTSNLLDGFVQLLTNHVGGGSFTDDLPTSAHGFYQVRVQRL
jgi:predicted acyl esterase